MPRYAGALLMSVGVAGILLPGPVGTPFFILGGVMVWPSLFRKPDQWMRRRFPGARRRALRFIERYQRDLNKRYPVRPPGGRDPRT